MVKGIARNSSEAQASPLVALLDDDPSFREALAGGISTFGCATVEAGSAEELLAILPKSRPICLILDYDLPDLNGLEVQAELAKGGYEIPTIFLTACDDDRIARAALTSGAIAFLTKPMRLSQLEPVIQGAMSSAQGETR